MASIFAHGAVALTLGYPLKKNNATVWNGLILWGIICSILPDVDVIGFNLGISYESMYGHRGITHSIFFSFLIACFGVMLFSRSSLSNLIVFLFQHSVAWPFRCYDNGRSRRRILCSF